MPRSAQYNTYNAYRLSCITELAEGNYTCHNTSKAGELPLKKIVLKVLGKTSRSPLNVLVIVYMSL